MSFAIKENRFPQEVVRRVEPAEHNITQIHLRDRIKGFFAKDELESFYNKYGITNEEIKKALQFIEESTGLKFDERIKSAKISLIDEKGYAKLLEADFLSILKELGADRSGKLKIGDTTYTSAELLELYKRIQELISPPAFYYSEDNTVYLREDRMDAFATQANLASGKWREVGVGPLKVRIEAKKPDKETMKPYVFECIIHELTHQAVGSNNPLIRSESSKQAAEMLKLNLELEVADERSKPALEARKKEVREKIALLNGWNEAIAEVVTSQVMRKFGFESSLVSYDYYINKGRELLAEVEKAGEATGKKSITVVVKNPPASMQELLNPSDYVGRLKELHEI